MATQTGLLDEDEYYRKFEDMQARTVEATRATGQLIRPGMSEIDVADIFKKELADRGLTDHWYPIQVHAGISTSLPISRRSHLPVADVFVKENDIVVLDCTPLDSTVWSNWAEGFIIGHDPFLEKLVADIQKIVDDAYEYATTQANTIGDIYSFVLDQAHQNGFKSLNPRKDVGHSIFQVPLGQTVEKTPLEDRLFISEEYSDRPITGIVSIEPQLGKKNPEDEQLYSAKMQRIVIKRD